VVVKIRVGQVTGNQFFFSLPYKNFMDTVSGCTLRK
jgi:hypothetical protein